MTGLLPSGPELTAAELDRVAAVLAGSGVDLAGPLSARLLSGGRSNLTFRLDDTRSSWVLRTPPRAGRTPSAHDVLREFRVTSALSSAPVPVPRAVVSHADADTIGGPFVVTEFVEGVVVQTRTQLQELTTPQCSAAITALVDTLAALHRVDHAAAGLADFGRPDGYAARQLKRWSGQWELVGAVFPDDVRRNAGTLIGLLGNRLPEQCATAIVHGDYRIDNALLRFGGPGTVEVAAVLDWELSTIGDPVADVASMCSYRHPAFDQVIGTSAAWTSDLLPDVPELASDYEKAGGAELVDFERHLALAYFKIAVIAAGIDHRRRAGAGTDDSFATARGAVAPYLEAALDVVR